MIRLQQIQMFWWRRVSTTHHDSRPPLICPGDPTITNSCRRCHHRRRIGRHSQPQPPTRSIPLMNIWDRRQKSQLADTCPSISRINNSAIYLSNLL